MRHSGLSVLQYVYLQLTIICTLSVVNFLQMQYFDESCVEFTTDQYHDIFISRFHSHVTLYKSLHTYAGIWKNKIKNCHNWNQYD